MYEVLKPGHTSLKLHFCSFSINSTSAWMLKHNQYKMKMNMHDINHLHDVMIFMCFIAWLITTVTL